ncbi:retrovirus-related Pol polyprotein from transposon TNT 1-94, partial [Trifolium medium]|nr:retrovirus-related Pol polyprotein from transposon TNT 1-94 [Trifolium medium]
RQGNLAPSDESKALVNAADSHCSKGYSNFGIGNFQGTNSKPGNRVCTFVEALGDDFIPPNDVKGGSPTITHAQYEQLMQLLQNSSVSNQFAVTSSSNQEKTTKRTIGSGDRVEDLYYLVIANKLVCNSSTSPFVTVPDSALWHFRLESLNKADKPFDLIHFDIWGPIAVHSVHHHTYFLTAVDDCSRSKLSELTMDLSFQYPLFMLHKSFMPFSL